MTRYTLTLLGERREITAADDSEAEAIAFRAVSDATGDNPLAGALGWHSHDGDWIAKLYRVTDGGDGPYYCGVIRREKI